MSTVLKFFAAGTASLDAKAQSPVFPLSRQA